MLSTETLDALATYFSGQAHVAAAFLYGSQSRGTAHGGSDVDVAVLLQRDEHVEPTRRLRLTNDLIDLLNRSDVDVVILNQASPVLLHRVARDGTVLFATDKSVVGEFIIRAMQQFVDTQPLRDLQDRQARQSFRDLLGNRNEQR